MTMENDLRNNHLASPEALDRAWERFRPRNNERLDAIEALVVGLLEGKPAEGFQHEARAAAHELAGSLGMLGYPEGTRRAREIEALLTGKHRLQPEDVLRIADLVVAMRAELDAARPSVSLPSSSPSAPSPDPGSASATLSHVRGPLLLAVNLEPTLLEQLELKSSLQGFTLHSTSDLSTTTQLLGAHEETVLLLDISSAETLANNLALISRARSLRPPVPVVVIAPWDTFTRRLEAVRNGIHAFLHKPVSPQFVVDVALRALGNRGARPGHILMVDDDEAVVEVVRVLLEKEGFTLTSVHNPLNFWPALHEHEPDLVVLAVEMPNVNGIELCRVIRSDPRWRGLPVFFLASRGGAGDVDAMFAAGADEYLLKPIVGRELVTRIRNRLAREAPSSLGGPGREISTALDFRGYVTGLASLLLGSVRRDGRPMTVGLVEMDKAMTPQAEALEDDIVTQRLAAFLASSLRACDVVGQYDRGRLLVALDGMDRREAADRLQHLLGTFCQTPTQGDPQPPVRLAARAGLAEYPLDGLQLEGLVAAADQALREGDRRETWTIRWAGQPPGEAPPLDRIDVLVVEDDELWSEVLVRALKARGLSCRLLQDGQDAVEALGGPLPTLRARLCLLEINLPNLDGLSVLRRLAADGVLRWTRFVMVTSRSTEKEILQAFELGAYDYVAKPLSLPILMHRVQKALR